MTTQQPEYANSANHNTDGEELVVELYDANQGKTPRTGGPYRDEIEREQAELIRSKFEDRDPDFDNPPPSAGTVLVPKSQLVERDVDKSHYSDAIDVVNEPVASYTVPEPVNEPDPGQPDWDNDMTKVAALDAGLKMQELREKAANKDTPEQPEPESFDAPQPEQTETVTEPSKPDTLDEAKLQGDSVTPDEDYHV